MERVSTVRIGEETVDVPESERTEFETAAQAKGMAWQPVRSVRIGEETVDVPENERAEFETAARDNGIAWEPVHTVRVGSDVVDVPQSEAEEFLKEYRAAPQFDEERKAAALKTAERMETLNAQRKAGQVVMDALESAGAGAANMFRGIGSAPLTLADKALAGAGFVTRGVEALYGEAGKSGFREAVEGARARLDRWREENMGFRDEEGRAAGPEDWGVTFGGQVANSVAEVYLAKGAGLALGGAKGAAAGGTAAAVAGRRRR